MSAWFSPLLGDPTARGGGPAGPSSGDTGWGEWEGGRRVPVGVCTRLPGEWG